MHGNLFLKNSTHIHMPCIYVGNSHSALANSDCSSNVKCASVRVIGISAKTEDE